MVNDPATVEPSAGGTSRPLRKELAGKATRRRRDHAGRKRSSSRRRLSAQPCKRGAGEEEDACREWTGRALGDSLCASTEGSEPRVGRGRSDAGLQRAVAQPAAATGSKRAGGAEGGVKMRVARFDHRNAGRRGGSAR